jgi:hypothetical protein
MRSRKGVSAETSREENSGEPVRAVRIRDWGMNALA